MYQVKNPTYLCDTSANNKKENKNKIQILRRLSKDSKHFILIGLLQFMHSEPKDQ